MARPRRLPFVCTPNEEASPPAEELFEKDPPSDAGSAEISTLFGTSVPANRLKRAESIVAAVQPVYPGVQ